MTEITPHNILRHELIGLKVRVTRATHPKLVGVRGVIIDESRNILTIDKSGRRIMVAKNAATFRFRLRNGTMVDVDGVRLLGRPENRLKTKVRRW